MKKVFVLALCALAGPVSAARFTPGDVFAKNNSGDIWNVTAGGNFIAASPFANVGSTSIGDPAWSPDLSTMYVSGGGVNVYAITPAGVVTPFATGLTGSGGLLTTQDGRLLVAESGSGQVTDITAGGDFTSAAPLASGLTNPKDLAQTPDGKIYVTEPGTGEISNITTGGVIGASEAFKVSFADDPLGLIAAPTGNGLLTVTPSYGRVWTMSDTGVATTFAVGKSLFGLAYTPGGRLLASESSGNAIYDVTVGGDITNAPLFANVTGSNNVAVVPVPEPASLALLAIGLAAVRRRRN